MPGPRSAKILMVDDRPEHLLALEAILQGLGHELIKAVSGEEALKCLLTTAAAVILLAVQMPGMDVFVELSQRRHELTVQAEGLRRQVDLYHFADLDRLSLQACEAVHQAQALQQGGASGLTAALE